MHAKRDVDYLFKHDRGKQSRAKNISELDGSWREGRARGGGRQWNPSSVIRTYHERAGDAAL